MSFPAATLPVQSFADKYGIVRTMHQSGGTQIDTSAVAYGNTTLNNSYYPAISAQLVLGGVYQGYVEGMRLTKGGTYPPWLVRPGQWIQIGEESAGQQHVLPIVRTTFNLNSLQLTAELGQPAIGWDLTVQQLRQTQQAYALGNNVLTGASNG
jgi:hypothetical protein